MAKSLPPVVTIDGPSGSGKGTVGQLLAQRLGWHFLDSGALYRVLGISAQKHQILLDDVSGLVGLIASMKVEFLAKKSDLPRVLLDGADVGDELRSETSGERASRIAVIPEIRQALMQKQHDFRQYPGLVADGRDMGTVVFPDADLKVFLTASAEERAQRRYKQLKEKGFDVNLPRLVSDIQARDARDEAREISPLKPADDANVIDATSLTIPEVVEAICGLMRDGVVGK